MKSPQTIWASVAVIFILVASSTTLIILDKEVTIILTLAMIVAVPVLGAFGVAVYQKLDQVKESSNGNLTRVLDMQQKAQDQLHALAMSMNAPIVTAKEGEKPADDFTSSVLLRPSGGLERN